MRRSYVSLIKMIIFFMLSFFLIYYYKKENGDTKLVTQYQNKYHDSYNNYQQRLQENIMAEISDEDRISCEVIKNTFINNLYIF